jgi:glucan 1,3-beta-glucosidase
LLLFLRLQFVSCAVFDMGLLHKDEAGHLEYTCDVVASQEASAARNLWLITGEWSLATTDCARWLNGMQRGARWDGTLDPSQPAIGTCSGDAGGSDSKNFTEPYRQFLRQFAETQMDVFETASENSAGWYFCQ